MQSLFPIFSYFFDTPSAKTPNRHGSASHQRLSSAKPMSLRFSFFFHSPVMPDCAEGKCNSPCAAHRCSFDIFSWVFNWSPMGE